MTRPRHFYRTAICIVRTPEGEAPQAVRDAWVGIVFPNAGRVLRPVEGMGVLSQPKTYVGRLIAGLLGRTCRVKGYAVLTDEAMQLLALHAPDAARWWQDNAAHIMGPGRVLLFNDESCQEM